jgi:hypothetical protein
MEISQEPLCGPLRHLHVGFSTSISDSASILLKTFGHEARCSSQQLCANATTLNSAIRVRCSLRPLVPLSVRHHCRIQLYGNTCWINYELECPRPLDEFRQRFPGLSM